MARWRLKRGYDPDELEEELALLRDAPAHLAEHKLVEMTLDRGYRIERYDWLVGQEPPGPPEPGGLFERAQRAVAHYDFSDPDIVEGHFVSAAPIVGRPMVLEIKVLGVHFLCGVRVVDAGFQQDDDRTSWSFRYDTLPGHLERGAQRFEVSKDHDTGEVRFAIDSRWQRGDLPNWWSRVGFKPLVLTYRAVWLRRAVDRLRALADRPQLSPLDVQSYGTVAALGALSGIRTTAAPALIAAHSLDRGAHDDAGLLEKVFASPVTSGFWAAAAAAETIADKHPRMPSRVEPPAITGRVLAAALAATVLSARWRIRPWGPLLLSGAAAVGSATLATRLRRVATGRPITSGLMGAGEDALIVAAGRWLLRCARSTSRAPPGRDR